MIPQIQPITYRRNAVIQPLQPLGRLQPSRFNRGPNYYSDITDPFAVDSTVDALFNRRGKEKIIYDNLGWDLGDVPILSDVAETVVASVLYVNHSFIKPALKGDVGAIIVNSLTDFTQTMDTAANLTKAMAMGDDGGKTSLSIGAGIGAVAAASAVLTGGVSLGAAAMAGLITTGVSSIIAGVIQDPMEAMDRLNKSTGFSDYGRTQYDFDTGSILFNMLGEMTLDPLNWGTFGQSFLIKQGIKKGWKVPAKTFGAMALLAEANDLVTKAAWTLNPLGASLRGVKKGFTYAMRYKGKAALMEAAQIVNNGIKSLDDLNKVQSSLNYAAREADEFRRGYAATGELNLIKGDSRQISVGVANLAQNLITAGVPEAKIHAVVKDILTSYMYGDLRSLVQIGGVWQYSRKALADILGDSAPELLVDVNHQALEALFKSLGTQFGAYETMLKQGSSPIIQAIDTYTDVIIRSSDFAQRALSSSDGLFKYYSSKLAEVMNKPESWLGFTGNTKVSKAQMMQYMLIKELPDIRQFIVIDPITKVQVLNYDAFLAKYQNTAAFYVLDTLARQNGLDLKDVFTFNGKVFDFAKTIEEALAEYNNPEVHKFASDYLGLAKGAIEGITAVGPDGTVSISRANSVLGATFGNIAAINRYYDQKNNLKGPMKQLLSDFSEQYGGKLKNIFDDIRNDLHKTMVSGKSTEISRWAKSLQQNYTSVLGFIDDLRGGLEAEGLTLSEVLYSTDVDLRIVNTIKEVFHSTLQGADEKDIKVFYNTLMAFIRFVEGFSHFDKRIGTFTGDINYNFDAFVSDMMRVNTYGEVGTLLRHIDKLPQDANTKKIAQFLKEFELLRPKFGFEERAAARLGMSQDNFVMRLSKQMMTLQHYWNISQDVKLLEHIEDLMDPDNALKQLLDDIANYEDNPYFDSLRNIAREILGSVEGYRNYTLLLKRLGNALDGTIKYNPDADAISRMLDPATLKIGTNGMIEIIPSITSGELIIDLASLPYYNGKLHTDMLKPDGTLDITSYLHSKTQVDFLRGVYHGMFEDPEVLTYIPLSNRLKTIAVDIQIGKSLDVEKDLLNLSKTISEAKDVLLKEQAAAKVVSAEEISAKIGVAKIEQLSMDAELFVNNLSEISDDTFKEATGMTKLEYVASLESTIDNAIKANAVAREGAETIAEGLESITKSSEAIANLQKMEKIVGQATEIVKTYKSYFDDGFYQKVDTSVIRLGGALEPANPLRKSYLKTSKFALGSNLPMAKGLDGKMRSFKTPTSFARFKVATEMKLANADEFITTGFRHAPDLEKIVNEKVIDKTIKTPDGMGKEVYKYPKDKLIYDKNIQLHKESETLRKYQLEYQRAKYLKPERRAFLKSEMSRLYQSIRRTKQTLVAQGYGTFNHNRHLIQSRIEMFKRVALQEYVVRNPVLMDDILSHAPNALDADFELIRKKLTVLFPERVIDFNTDVPVRSHLVWNAGVIAGLVADTDYTVTPEEMALFAKGIIQHSSDKAITQVDMIFDGALARDHNAMFKYMSVAAVGENKRLAFADNVVIRLIGPDGQIYTGKDAFNDYTNYTRKVRTLLNGKYKGDLDKLPEGHGYISFKNYSNVSKEIAIQDLFDRFIRMPYTPERFLGANMNYIKSQLLNPGDHYVDISKAIYGRTDRYVKGKEILGNLIKQAKNNPAKLIYVGHSNHPRFLKELLKDFPVNKLPDNLIFPEDVTPNRAYRIQTLEQFKAAAEARLSKKYSLTADVDATTGDDVFKLQLESNGQPTRYGKLIKRLEETKAKYDSLRGEENVTGEYSIRDLFATRYDTGLGPSYDTRFSKVFTSFDDYFFKDPSKYTTRHFSFGEHGVAIKIHESFNKKLDGLLVKFDDDNFWNEAILHRRKMALEKAAPVEPKRADFVKFATEEEAIAFYRSEEYASLYRQQEVDHIMDAYNNDPTQYLDKHFNKVPLSEIEDYINKLEIEKIDKKKAVSLYRKTISEYNKAFKAYQKELAAYEKIAKSVETANLVESSFKKLRLNPEEKAFIAEQKALINGIRAKNNLYQTEILKFNARVEELGYPNLGDPILRNHIYNINHVFFPALNTEISTIKRPGSMGGSEDIQKALKSMRGARKSLDDFYEELRTDPMLRDVKLRLETGEIFSNTYDPSKPAKSINDMYQEYLRSQISSLSRSEAGSKYKNNFRNIGVRYETPKPTTPKVIPFSERPKPQIINKIARVRTGEGSYGHYIGGGDKYHTASALASPFDDTKMTVANIEKSYSAYMNKMLDRPDSPFYQEFMTLKSEYDAGKKVGLIDGRAGGSIHGKVLIDKLEEMAKSESIRVPKVLKKSIKDVQTFDTAPNDRILVFGSNSLGVHGLGLAHTAKTLYGAIEGQASGLQGNSYGLVTKISPTEFAPKDVFQNSMSDFIDYAFEHPDLEFHLPDVGTGLAGFKDHDLAEVVTKALEKHGGVDAFPANVTISPDLKKILSKGTGDTELGVKGLRVISGGASGADLGGLLSAQRYGIATGGSVPKGFRTDNNNPEQLKALGLVEDTSGASDIKVALALRSQKNVDDADGTIAFMPYEDSVGTSKTVGYAQTGKWQHRIPNFDVTPHKPNLVIDWGESNEEAAQKIIKFMRDNQIETLNIAGSRESKAKGMQVRVEAIMDLVFEELKNSPYAIRKVAQGTSSATSNVKAPFTSFKPEFPDNKSVAKIFERDYITGSGQEINDFSGSNSYLSNFYRESPFELNNVFYPTSEHAFQAAKASNEKDFQYILDAPTASEAKTRGKMIKPRADWEDIKDAMMYEIVKAKFDNNPSIKARLLSTGKAYLSEGNWWGDTYWGVDHKKGGYNYLGQILMFLREQYRRDPNSVALDIPYTQKTKLPSFMDPRDVGRNLDTLSLSDLYRGVKGVLDKKTSELSDVTDLMTNKDPVARFTEASKLSDVAAKSEYFGKVTPNPLEQAPDPIPNMPIKKVPVKEMPGTAFDTTAPGKIKLSSFGSLKMRDKIASFTPRTKTFKPVFTTFGNEVSGDVLERFYNVEQLFKKLLNYEDGGAEYVEMSQSYSGFYPDNLNLFTRFEDFAGASMDAQLGRLYVSYLDPGSAHNVRPHLKPLVDVLRSAGSYFHERYVVNLYYQEDYDFLIELLQKMIKDGGIK